MSNEDKSTYQSAWMVRVACINKYCPYRYDDNRCKHSEVHGLCTIENCPLKVNTEGHGKEDAENESR